MPKILVAVFGGAFNPITKGHIETAQFILNVGFDEIWLMPCYNHMAGKSLVPAEDRLEMCKLAAKVDGRIKVSDYEIKCQLSGESYHLAKMLLSEVEFKDRYDFSIAIGMDNALQLDKWAMSAELEKLIRFVVVSRQGYHLDAATIASPWFLKPPHIFLNADKAIRQISSSKIRECFKTNSQEVLGEELDPAVATYIAKKRFYCQ